MGLHTKHIFLSSTIREFAGKHNAICIKIRFPQRWTGCGWISRKAGLLRCRLALGEAPGLRRGAAAFGGRGAAPGPPLGLPNKRARPGPKAPASLFQGASRPAAAPPGTLEFPPALRSIHHPFPPRLPIKKPSPPLPMSGPPAYSAGNPEKFSSQFSPAFLKAGQGGGAERRQWRKKRGGSPVSKGVEGSRFGGDAQRPLRTARGAGSPPHEPPNGVQGRSPWRGPGQRPGSRAPSRHPEQAAGVLEGGVQQLRQGALVELRQLLGDEGEEGGVVALAPVGHRGHVGAIGLQ